MIKPAELIKAIEDGRFDNTFGALYARDPETVAAQRRRYIDAVKEFEADYGADREVTIYSAPGRTEIGGNHTDHNNGVVMAAAINLDIIAVVSPNDENIIRVRSAGFGQADVVDISVVEKQPEEAGRSAALLRGLAAAIKKWGGSAGGFDAYTTSNVLKGSGLSSSAAFEVCIAAVLNGLYNAGRFTPVELARMSQFAENEYFGKPCGLMDQTSCAVGSAVMIDFKDPENPIVEKIPLDLAGNDLCLVITDTKDDHADLTPDYAAIRSEMEQVAACFGKKVLREVDSAEFFAGIPAVRAKTGDRAVLRAIHFYDECRRAGQLAQSAREDDMDAFMLAILESGHSSFEYNQNAYSLSRPAQQGMPLGLALSQHVLAGHGVWRLQGGGFAGTIQAFVPKQMLKTYCDTLAAVFGDDACHVLDVRAAGCTEVLAD